MRLVVSLRKGEADDFSSSNSRSTSTGVSTVTDYRSSTSGVWSCIMEGNAFLDVLQRHLCLSKGSRLSSWTNQPISVGQKSMILCFRAVVPCRAVKYQHRRQSTLYKPDRRLLTSATSLLPNRRRLLSAVTAAPFFRHRPCDSVSTSTTRPGIMFGITRTSALRGESLRLSVWSASVGR